MQNQPSSYQNYDEKCPVPGIDKKTVLVEKSDMETTRLCMLTGYSSFSSWSDPTSCAAHEEIIPQFVRDTKLIDESGRVWFKIIITSPVCILFPEPNNLWTVSAIRPMQENENNVNVFLWEGKPFVVDNDKTQTFDMFLDAFDRFNYIFNTSSNEHD